MSIQAFEIPDYFNQDWYSQERELGKNDAEIALELIISKSLLEKWKQRKGVYAGGSGKYSGRKPMVDVNRIYEMNKQGMRPFEIAKVLDVNPKVVRYHLKKLTFA